MAATAGMSKKPQKPKAETLTYLASVSHLFGAKTHSGAGAEEDESYYDGAQDDALGDEAALENVVNELKFEAVDDAGALPKKALRDRQQKEAASLAAFEGGSLVRLTRLKDVHAWVTSRHAAYSIPGVLEKKPMDAALAASY